MRTNILTSIGIALVAVLTFGLLASGFTNFEKSRITKVKNRIGRVETRVATLEAIVIEQQSQIDLLTEGYANVDAGLLALTEDGGTLWQLDRNILWVQEVVDREHPSITIDDIIPEMDCNDIECDVSVAWTSDPPATGQVEWGLTSEYGNLTKKEDGLLDFHRQFVGTFPLDTTVHFRVLAEVPEEGISVSSPTVAIATA